MQRVRKVVSGGNLIVVEVVDDQVNPRFGGSNAMYLLEHHEFGENEYDAALGRAVRERAEDMIHGEPQPAEGDTASEVVDNG